jgi:hypothetical protein
MQVSSVADDFPSDDVTDCIPLDSSFLGETSSTLSHHMLQSGFNAALCTLPSDGASSDEVSEAMHDTLCTSCNTATVFPTVTDLVGAFPVCAAADTPPPDRGDGVEVPDLSISPRSSGEIHLAGPGSMDICLAAIGSTAGQGGNATQMTDESSCMLGSPQLPVGAFGK